MFDCSICRHSYLCGSIESVISNVVQGLRYLVLSPEGGDATLWPFIPPNPLGGRVGGGGYHRCRCLIKKFI
jgi:hypothetical protein